MNFQYSRKFSFPILAAYAVIDTKNGDVLLVEDQKPTGSSPKTKFPGGKIKLDKSGFPLEAPFEALARELSEELGYTGPLTVLEIYEIEKPEQDHAILFYRISEKIDFNAIRKGFNIFAVKEIKKSELEKEIPWMLPFHYKVAEYFYLQKCP